MLSVSKLHGLGNSNSFPGLRCVLTTMKAYLGTYLGTCVLNRVGKCMGCTVCMWWHREIPWPTIGPRLTHQQMRFHPT